MAIVVIGGHSRNVGKTSAVASLIARLRHHNWLAMKITQFGHGFCTADGAPCDCQTDEHTVAFTFERPGSPGYNAETDTARFLSAGAVKSLWVRTRIGNLAPAMPRIRKEIAAAENTIIESNSIMGFLKPDLYLSVLDHGTADFKESARLFLDRADAILLRQESRQLAPQWRGVSGKLVEAVPQFYIQVPEYMSDEVAQFVEKMVISVAGSRVHPAAPVTHARRAQSAQS
jgi:hypothetical protein